MDKEDNIYIEFKQGCCCNNLNNNQIQICNSHPKRKNVHSVTAATDSLDKEDTFLIYDSVDKEPVFLQRFIYVIYTVSFVLIVICLSIDLFI